jgi:hypothetical protein
MQRERELSDFGARVVRACALLTQSTGVSIYVSPGVMLLDLTCRMSHAYRTMYCPHCGA